MDSTTSSSSSSPCPGGPVLPELTLVFALICRGWIESDEHDMTLFWVPCAPEGVSVFAAG